VTRPRNSAAWRTQHNAIVAALNLMKCIKIRGNVFAVFIRYTHLRHCGMLLNLMRVHDPVPQVVRRISYLARNIDTQSKGVKRRANLCIGFGNSRDGVASAATVILYFVGPRCGFPPVARIATLISFARWTSLRLYPTSRIAVTTRKIMSNAARQGLCILHSSIALGM